MIKLPMKIQILILVAYALNLWLVNKFSPYRLIGSFLFACLPLINVFFPQPRFELDYFWWEIAGYTFMVIGLALMLWAKKALANVITNLSEVPSNLVMTGPYHYLRHPMYLGLGFIFVGWWWVWAAVYAFYFGMFILAMIWLQGYLEDKIMEKKFGAKFAAYRRETGMFWIK
jgi:protein-S-isoprenylcysteine O-methyltransferase Ste14